MLNITLDSCYGGGGGDGGVYFLVIQRKRPCIEFSQHIFGSCYKPRYEIFCLLFKLILMSLWRLCVFGTTVWFFNTVLITITYVVDECNNDAVKTLT